MTLPDFSRGPRDEGWAGFLLLLLLAGAWWALAPGLPGGFLIDDVQNLQPLDDIARRPAWQSVLAYALNGVGGSRPLSYLSFAAQYSDWPANPEALRRVGLALHLLNGCLVLALLLRVGELAGLTRRIAVIAALAATAGFLLHPLQVSTVLYIVQRMTLLATLFTLLALLCYLRGRGEVARGRARAGIAWLAAGFPLCTLLAVLSKESGVNVLLYVAVLELTVLRRHPVSRAWDRGLAALGVAVGAAVAAYVATQIDNWALAYRLREFGPWERLLTQPGVLLDYLGKLLLPRPSHFGLYFDDYPAARGLLLPPGTLLAVVAVIAMVLAGILLRRRAPLAAMGILWFFAGHLLEASPLPLELYFEHRNYLALLGPLYAIACYVTMAAERAPGWVPRAAAGGFAAILVALYGSVTWQEARLWSDPFKQALIWAEERPTSKRAQIVVATWLSAHAPMRAVEVLRRADRVDPGDARFLLMWYALACANAQVSPPDLESLLRRLESSKYSHTVMASLDDIASQREAGRCKHVSHDELARVLSAILANDRFGNPAARGYVHFHLGRIHAAEGLLDEAMASLDRAFMLLPKPEIVSYQVSWLASAGLYDDALRYLDLAAKASLAQGLRHRFMIQQIEGWRESVLNLKRAAARPVAAGGTAK